MKYETRCLSIAWFPQLNPMSILRYGADSSVRLDFAKGVLPIEFGTPRDRPPDDLAAAVARVLNEPLEYPALAQCTTPGDQVVLALEHGVPQTPQLAAAVVQALVEAGVQPDGITVLRTQADIDTTTEDPCGLLPLSVRRRIMMAVHDPSDRNMLAYLASTEAGEPVLLHRAIHDADLVLPIGCLRAEQSRDYFGIHGAVFPTFSDEKTLARFRAPGLLAPGDKRKRELVREVDEVAWLLGVNFTVQVIPGSGSSVLHVVAGQSEAVRRRSCQLYAAAWNCSAPQRASLVVAAIEGNCQQQTWRNVGRALDAASELVEDGGSIAVCCELAASPGAAMQQMMGAESRRTAMGRTNRDRPEDAVPAAQLARALERGKVYLLSKLEASVVEDLEMIHVGNGAELSRLVRRHPSCVVLSNAPYAMVKPPCRQ